MKLQKLFGDDKPLQKKKKHCLGTKTYHSIIQDYNLEWRQIQGPNEYFNLLKIVFINNFEPSKNSNFFHLVDQFSKQFC